MARKPSRKDLDALAQAQDLVYDAWEEDSPTRRLALAGRALGTSPLCADAWSILAAHAPAGSEERLELLHRAVDAGTSALGNSFEEFRGHFWGFLETRPLMRARQALAMELWRRGSRDEAIDHLQDMLRLNPNDHQGLRYALLAWLAETDRYSEIAALEETCSEETAMWTWPLALASFRRSGDSTETRLALVKAVRSNRHVAPLLLGRKRLPASLPDFYGSGDVDEPSFTSQTRAADGRPRRERSSGWRRSFRICLRSKPGVPDPGHRLRGGGADRTLVAPAGLLQLPTVRSRYVVTAQASQHIRGSQQNCRGHMLR